MNMKDLEALPGVGKGTADKMREGGILSLMSVATSTPGQMSDACGMTAASARKVINAARDMCELGFEMGNEVQEKEEATGIIATHYEPIDRLLGGGLELGTTMEVFGEFACGKTNLSHLLAVSTLKQYPDSYVVWIDTESTFKTSRIRDFCKGLDVDPELVLKHIKVGKALTSDHQILLTENIEKDIVEKEHDVKLLILDSLTNHFRAEYLGRGTLANRQQTLNGYLHKIGKLADMYTMAVYMTNQIQADPGQMFGDPNKAIGGNIVGHFATTRLYIRKAAKNTRKIILIDSPNLAPGDAHFEIGENSLLAVEDKKEIKIEEEK